MRFGLSTADSTNATFSDWGYGLKFDDLYAVAGRTLTLSDGITAKIGETEVTDGKVLLGDTVTVSMTSENRVTFSVDGAPVATDHNENVYTASFAVTGNHTLTVKEVRTVTGTIGKNDIYSSDATKDITATTIKAYAGGELVGTFEGNVGAGGAYSIGLVDGEYTLEFENPHFMTVSKPVTVSGGAATVGEAEFTLAKIDGGWGDWVYDEANKRVTLPANVDSAFKTFAGVSGSRVLATMTVSNIDTRYDGWASAGIRIETQSGGIMYFSLTETVNNAGENGAVKIRILRFDKWEYVTDFGVGETDADYTAAKLTVCVADNAVYLYVNDTLRYTISATQNTAIYEKLRSIGFFAENANYKPCLSVVKPGENVTVSAFDATADGAIMDKLLERTLSLPEGVTAKAGETEIIDGKVLLGDTVTVSMTSENRVTFSVDGAPVATETDGNIYTASFVVTGNHAVTYEYSYAVSGKIAKPDYATADLTSTVLKFTSGETAEFGGAVNANGEYTVYLPAGEYAMRAEHAGFMPASGGAVTVTSAAVENANAAFTLVRPENMNGLTYDESTGKLSNKGDIVTCFGSGSDFVVTTYVDKITTEWKAAGLVLRDASTNKFVKIAIRKTASGFDLFSHLGDGYMDFPAIADPFTQNGERAKLTVVRRSASLAVFINDEFVVAIGISASTAVHHWGTPDTVLTDYLTPGGEYSFGLGTCDNTNATFSEWSYGLTFSDLYAVGGKTLTLPEGATAKVGETEITDGKAILGDAVTVSMTSENRVTFSVDGVTVTTDHNENVYTASFTVTGNHTVTYEEAYAVSGTISYPDYATADLASTVLKFIKDGAATEFTDVVGASGEYSVYLPAGEYTVRAEHAGFMPVVGDTIAVTNAAVENVGVAFTLVKPENMNGLTYDEGTGKLSNSGDIVTYFGSGNDFAATTYIDKITTDWKAAGIVVGDATKKNFVKFTIRKREDGNCDLFVNVGDGYMEMPVIGNPFMQSGERAKLTVERIGATIKVYVNDELKSTIAVADTTVVKHWGSADTKITDYLSADGEYRFGFGTCDGTNATFSEWSYKLK